MFLSKNLTFLCLIWATIFSISSGPLAAGAAGLCGSVHLEILKQSYLGISDKYQARTPEQQKLRESAEAYKEIRAMSEWAKQAHHISFLATELTPLIDSVENSLENNWFTSDIQEGPIQKQEIRNILKNKAQILEAFEVLKEEIAEHKASRTVSYTWFLMMSYRLHLLVMDPLMSIHELHPERANNKKSFFAMLENPVLKNRSPYLLDLFSNSIQNHSEYMLMPTSVSLNARQLLEMMASGIHPLGIIDQPITVDGISFPYTPAGFYDHDLNHVIAWRSYMSKDPLERMQVEHFIQDFVRFYQRKPDSEAKYLAIVGFLALRETVTNMTVINDVIHAAKDDKEYKIIRNGERLYLPEMFSTDTALMRLKDKNDLNSELSSVEQWTGLGVKSNIKNAYAVLRKFLVQWQLH